MERHRLTFGVQSAGTSIRFRRIDTGNGTRRPCPKCPISMSHVPKCQIEQRCCCPCYSGVLPVLRPCCYFSMAYRRDPPLTSAQPLPNHGATPRFQLESIAYVTATYLFVSREVRLIGWSVFPRWRAACFCFFDCSAVWCAAYPGRARVAQAKRVMSSALMSSKRAGTCRCARSLAARACPSAHPCHSRMTLVPLMTRIAVMTNVARLRLSIASVRVGRVTLNSVMLIRIVATVSA